MRLRLTLVRADASRRDISVTADAAATVGDLARAIRDADSGASARTAIDQPTLRRFDGGPDPGGAAGESWSVIAPATRIDEGRLASGAFVALADASNAHRPATIGAVVEARSGSRRGERWSLPAGTTIVGRSPDCDLVLDDPYVSGRHVRIEVADAVELIDLGSANGIEVDGETVERIRLTVSSDVTLGETRLRVVLGEGSGTGIAGHVLHRAGAPVAFTRSPRVEPRYRGGRFIVPTIPQGLQRRAVPWSALAAPVLVGLVLAVVLGRPSMLLFLLLSPLLLLSTVIAERLRSRRALARSMRDFEAGLAALRTETGAEFARERAARVAEAPSAEQVVAAALERAPLLWTRRPEHDSFLDLRLGLAAMPTRSELDVPPRRGDDRGLDPGLDLGLRDRLDRFVAAHREVADVPVVANLYDAGAVGVAGAERLAAPVLRGLVAQLIGLHSPADVAVAAVLPSAWASELEWLRWVPHVASPHSPLGERRHLADRPVAAAELVAAVEQLIEERLKPGQVLRRGAMPGHGGAAGTRAQGSEIQSSGTPARLPALLLLIAHDAPVAPARLTRIGELGPDAGVFMIWAAPTVAELPAVCRVVLEVAGEGIGAVGMVRLGTRIEPVSTEGLTLRAAETFARALAPLTDSGAPISDATDLPQSVPITRTIAPELFDSSAAVLDRWGENDPITDHGGTPPAVRRARLRAPVGLTARGTMHLDLRAQGPHALVGGTTGSGKSELLQAWVLGLASEHSPERVTFLFVDYKGGSAFADCVRLPHAVGLVTDLTPALVRRALTSLRAELRHRERLLSRRQGKDLIELERRGDPEAPPALVIVVDEFAALATDVPEFVDGVIDLAQRGRSLGIHLILATQRPAGVIKDNLRANTDLRIALRMADDADSQDVVGVPDAARIDPALPGRALVRVGSGRAETFQSAYPSGWSSPETGTPRVEIADLRFGSGAPWPPRAPTIGGDGPNDQRRLVDSIIGAAGATGVPSPRRPWLDELPATVELGSLPPGDDRTIPFGWIDDPARQRRLPAVFRPDTDGHIAFIGAGGSGKSYALRTLMLAAGLAKDSGPVHGYVLDAAAGSLRPLAALPQVGAVIRSEDAERVRRLLRTIGRELAERAARFAEVSATDLIDYRSRAGHPAAPRILLLIDGFPAFREEWEHVPGRSAWYDVLRDVLADGRRLGIHVVLTADRPGALPGSVTASIGRRVHLRPTDDARSEAVGASKDLLDAASPPGRAIIDGREAQIASGQVPAGGEHRGPGTAPAIETLLEVISPAAMPDSVDGRPVLGVEDESLTPTGFEPRGVMLLSGPPGSGRTNALAWFARALRAFDPSVQLVRIGMTAPEDGHGADRVAHDAESAAVLAADLAGEMADGATGGRIAVIIEGLADFLQSPAEIALLALIRRMRRGDHFLLAESDAAGWAGAWPLLAEVRQARRGLLLQPEPTDGEVVLRTPLPRSPRSEFPPGRGMYVERGRSQRVQLPHMETAAGTHPQLPTFPMRPAPRPA